MTDGVNTAPWYADAIAREESQLQGITRRYNQFNGLNSSDAKIEGTPNWGTPSGWGLFQLEIEQRSGLPLRTLHRWDWQENANLALTLLTQNATAARDYLDDQHEIPRQQMGTDQPIPDNLGVVGNCNFLDRDPQSPHNFADAVAIGMWNGGPNYHFVRWDQHQRQWVIRPFTVWRDQQGVAHHNMYVQAVCGEVQ